MAMSLPCFSCRMARKSFFRSQPRDADLACEESQGASFDPHGSTRQSTGRATSSSRSSTSVTSSGRPWVTKYKTEGPQSLEPRRRGRPKGSGGNLKRVLAGERARKGTKAAKREEVAPVPPNEPPPSELARAAKKRKGTSLGR